VLLNANSDGDNKTLRAHRHGLFLSASGNVRALVLDVSGLSITASRMQATTVSAGPTPLTVQDIPPASGAALPQITVGGFGGVTDSLKFDWVTNSYLDPGRIGDPSNQIDRPTIPPHTVTVTNYQVVAAPGIYRLNAQLVDRAGNAITADQWSFWKDVDLPTARLAGCGNSQFFIALYHNSLSDMLICVAKTFGNHPCSSLAISSR
jgi:hypothetical protein